MSGRTPLPTAGGTAATSAVRTFLRLWLRRCAGEVIGLAPSWTLPELLNAVSQREHPRVRTLIWLVDRLLNRVEEAVFERPEIEVQRDEILRVLEIRNLMDLRCLNAQHRSRFEVFRVIRP